MVESRLILSNRRNRRSNASGKGTNLPVSIISPVGGGDMFSKKKFIFNGKARKRISPSPTPPECLPVEAFSLTSDSTQSVDFSRFDFMGIEEFLATLMEKSEKNDAALWRASCVLSTQLKNSRALLSLRSYLSSFDQTVSALDRLMDTAYFILNAENVYILLLDTNGTDLVVTHTHANGAIGLKGPMGDVFPGI